MMEYFDNDRQEGIRPPKGYGWMDNESKKAFVIRSLGQGNRKPWIIREANRFGVSIEGEF